MKSPSDFLILLLLSLRPLLMFLLAWRWGHWESWGPPTESMPVLEQLYLANAIWIYSDLPKWTARIIRQLSQSNSYKQFFHFILDCVDHTFLVRVPQGFSWASRGFRSLETMFHFVGVRKTWSFLRRGFLFFIKFSELSNANKVKNN